MIFVCDFFVISKRVYEEKISDLPLGFNIIIVFQRSVKSQFMLYQENYTWAARSVNIKNCPFGIQSKLVSRPQTSYGKSAYKMQCKYFYIYFSKT